MEESFKGVLADIKTKFELSKGQASPTISKEMSLTSYGVGSGRAYSARDKNALNTHAWTDDPDVHNTINQGGILRRPGGGGGGSG